MCNINCSFVYSERNALTCCADYRTIIIVNTLNGGKKSMHSTLPTMLTLWISISPRPHPFHWLRLTTAVYEPYCSCVLCLVCCVTDMGVSIYRSCLRYRSFSFQTKRWIFKYNSTVLLTLAQTYRLHHLHVNFQWFYYFHCILDY